MNDINNPIEVVLKSNPNYTIEKIADIMQTTRQSVSSYRKNPQSINAQQLFLLSRATGISMEKLIGTSEMEKGPSIPATYEKKRGKLDRAIKKAESFLEEIEMCEVDGRLKTAIRRKGEIENELKNLIETSEVIGHKPMLCAFGPSDAGKSTLGNYLFGENIIPAKYTPMTSAPTYFMHISEMPDGIMESTKENTVVYGRRNENDKKLNHKDYAAGDCAHIIKTGIYKDLLGSFGTREGEYFKSEEFVVDEIIVYLDLPILKELTFVDFPGFGSGEESDDVSLTMDVSAFDVIFILSQANGFIDGKDMSAIVNIFRRKDNLDGIYILATHANAVGKPEEVKKILNEGCVRIVSIMSEDEKDRLHINEKNFKALKNQCYGFDPNLPYWCSEINKELEKKLPMMIKRNVGDAIKKLTEACNEYQVEYTKKIKNAKVKSRRGACSDKEWKDAEKVIANSKEKNEEIRGKLLQFTKDTEAYCLDRIKSRYDEIVSKEYIESVIVRKGIKNNKKGMEMLANYISEELNDACTKPMKKTSEEFSDKVKTLLADYEKDIKENDGFDGINIDMNGFDFTRAFASGLAGVATYGALAIWANAVAAGSNLGAYILVAKVVSVLSSLGISLGGSGAVAAFVASIGGPATLGIALAVLSAIAVFGIFTGTWKSRAAKKIKDTYDNNGTLEKMQKAVRNYWSDTRKAINKCMDSLQKEMEEHIKNQLNEGMSNEEIVLANDKIMYLYKKCLLFYEQMCDLLE